MVYFLLADFEQVSSSREKTFTGFDLYTAGLLIFPYLSLSPFNLDELDAEREKGSKVKAKIGP